MDEVPSTLSRRSLLAGFAAGCGTLAGCAGVGGGDCSFGFELVMTPATEADLIEETLTGPSRDRPDDWRAIVSETVEDGEARYTTVHAPPVRDGDRIEYEGGYYRFSREEVTTEEVEAHVFRVTYDRGEDPPSGATVSPFDDLPEADRTALHEMFPDLDRRLAESQGFTVGGYPVVYPDEAEPDSVLIGRGSTWVRYDGEVLDVTVEGIERVERVTYRYTVEELAADREAYLQYVRETFVVELADFPAAEREVLSRAVEAGESGIQLCEPEGAERALIERLDAIPESRTPRHRTWFIEYDGGVYLASMIEFTV